MVAAAGVMRAVACLVAGKAVVGTSEVSAARVVRAAQVEDLVASQDTAVDEMGAALMEEAADAQVVGAQVMVGWLVGWVGTVEAAAVLEVAEVAKAAPVRRCSRVPSAQR